MEEIKDNQKSFLYILKKSERLVSAIYKVTDLIEPTDVLIGHTRELAVLIFKDILVSAYVAHTSHVRERIFMMMETLIVLEEAGRISPMNAQILRDAYNTLLTDSPSLFETRERAVPLVQMKSTQERFSQGNVFSSESLRSYIGHGEERDTRESTEKAHGQAHQMTDTKIQRTGGIAQGESEIKRTDVNEGQQESDFKHNDRKALILSLLQRKQHITIRDVSAVIKDVSEKTIQRELLSMVESGLLKKQGERRWSTYSLSVR